MLPILHNVIYYLFFVNTISFPEALQRLQGSYSDKHDEENFMGIRMIEKLVEEIVYRKVFGVNTLIIKLRMVK